MTEHDGVIVNPDGSVDVTVQVFVNGIDHPVMTQRVTVMPREIGPDEDPRLTMDFSSVLRYLGRKLRLGGPRG